MYTCMHGCAQTSRLLASPIPQPSRIFASHWQWPWKGKCYNCGSAQQNPASPTCYRCGTCQHTNEEEEEEEEAGEGLTEAEQQIYDTIPDLYSTNWKEEEDKTEPTVHGLHRPS